MRKGEGTKLAGKKPAKNTICFLNYHFVIEANSSLKLQIMMKCLKNLLEEIEPNKTYQLFVECADVLLRHLVGVP